MSLWWNDSHAFFKWLFSWAFPSRGLSVCEAVICVNCLQIPSTANIHDEFCCEASVCAKCCSDTNLFIGTLPFVVSRRRQHGHTSENRPKKKKRKSPQFVRQCRRSRHREQSVPFSSSNIYHMPAAAWEVVWHIIAPTSITGCAFGHTNLTLVIIRASRSTAKNSFRYYFRLSTHHLIRPPPPFPLALLFIWWILFCVSGRPIPSKYCRRKSSFIFT